MSELLIVFCKNPVPGKVKTRLAKGIGEEKALEVYKKLLDHTLAVAKGSSRDYAVYYADFVNENDLWQRAAYKEIQTGEDIGDRMSNAIANGLSKGYDSVALIGADIYDLTPKIIDQAFTALYQSDIVIGPAKDGGYYLIGMKSPNSEIFKLHEWSTPSVLEETIEQVNRKGLSVYFLAELNDIDHQEDLEGTDLIELISAPQDRG